MEPELEREVARQREAYNSVRIHDCLKPVCDSKQGYIVT
jgi:hypothetical protein